MSDNDKALLGRRFGMAEAKRNIFFATVEEHVAPEDVLRPSFWAHTSGPMRPYDEIIVAVDSCAWRLHLLVRDAWHGGAAVIELSRHDMQSDEEITNQEAVDLRVQWRGPQVKWCVVRKDGVIVQANLPDKGTALQNLAAIAEQRVA